ncbi:peptidylprolyl isomerase [Shewanella sp. C32]|uniref:peptidylprolyl isomerase n=1 Tax=Shewanella electrica TaxID=515560 RepID=A0ABT2FL13_9GAMM|nr:peptidylprolyl isomerase [Shewanella electrica]MCH1924031.1 peptidylprolyl isomerase [Shewanella electrica]MCS4555934.1 peptidylprolyl isomerase [Shewanella electrica]
METQKRRYLTAKVATEMFKLNPEFLKPEQQQQVASQVQRVMQLQQAILGSREAAEISVSAAQLEQTWAQCLAQFDGEASLVQSLQNQGLDAEGLRSALYDELRCELVLDRVCGDIPPLALEQAQAYFAGHRQEFSRAAIWQLSQILITVNHDYPENRRHAVLKRICRVRHLAQTQDFAALALQHSECPSAMEQGFLGWCEQDKLYPQIAAVLPTLAHMQVSDPIETELGFHLVRWHQYKPAKVANFDEVLPLLQQRHHERAKKYLQKQWLNRVLTN